MYKKRDYWPTEDWRTSTPQEQGMDAGWQPQLMAYIGQTRPYLNAVLVIRHGYLVFEYYKENYSRESYQILNSATKSFTATLIGLALRDGFLTELDQCLEEFLPDAFRHLEVHPYKRQITMRQLLKMTSGLYPDALLQYDDAEDWVRFALESPTLCPPDQLFLYSSISSHLLSVILSHATGMSTLAYARKVLFEPLGIRTDERAGFIWGQDPQGYYRGAGGLHLRARDVAKLGYLYLNEGLWEDTRLLPSTYVQEATRKQTSGGSPEAAGYGYQWWIAELAGQRYFFASGFGGQYLQVFPDLDLILVLHAPDEPFTGAYHRQFIPLAFLLPAMNT
ncbi:serine hydrolase domain-containing protein [Dictyobacter aurantiacus]|uniref:Serine hydrolase n=1 Tax=Dictyobacter aurantiacus TaxID=1936993 RepID=A0A401ZKT7_9CHLR|nr:serine hydrolase [Dictyobacter aurantiacus]GCE07479.1 serine hydrolase [Dictyobacter aurantiacus]